MRYETTGKEPAWQRRCESGACVEVAFHDEAVLIRSSATPEAVIAVTLDEWRAFLADTKSGFFDQLFLKITARANRGDRCRPVSEVGR